MIIALDSSKSSKGIATTHFKLKKFAKNIIRCCIVSKLISLVYTYRLLHISYASGDEYPWLCFQIRFFFHNQNINFIFFCPQICFKITKTVIGISAESYHPQIYENWYVHANSTNNIKHKMNIVQSYKTWCSKNNNNFILCDSSVDKIDINCGNLKWKSPFKITEMLESLTMFGKFILKGVVLC